MISLIICSTKKETPQWLVENIKQTIGAEYEIIHIDNSENRFNMCSAYNEGIRRANGDVLCFMHEDIKYYSQDWGKSIERHMQNPDVSMLGVFGSTVVPKDFDFRFSGFTTGHLIQRTVRISNPKEYVLDGVNWDVNAPLMNVAMVDGCWFCIKASLFKGDNPIRFDDKTFDSFHLYDCDICMQVNERKKGIYLVSDIVLEHFSEGVFADGYLDGINKFFSKWADSLPCCIKGMNVESCAERLKKGKAFYKKILVRDKMIMSLRKYFAAKKAGEPVGPLTNDDIRSFQRLEFRYAKCVIKYSPTQKEALRAFDTFQNLPLFGKYSKIKLIGKFFFYRYISPNKKWKKNSIYLADKKNMSNFASAILPKNQNK